MHNLQTKHHAGCDDVNMAIRMIREQNMFVSITEHFDESILLLRNWVKPYQILLNYVAKNVAHDALISNNLVNDAKTHAMLQEINHSDSLLYDYIKNEVFPAQIN
jgi:hypothetical protein